MKNILIILFAFLALTCCTTDKTEKVISKKEVAPTSETTEEKPNYVLNQPAFFMGSDFMHFMQACRKIGDIDRMVQFTHSESIKRYGTNKVKEFYKHTNITYEMELKSIQKEDSVYVMNYVSNKFATKGVVRFNVVVENDTCKLVLPYHLSKFGE